MKRSYINTFLILAIIAFPYWVYIPLVVVTTLYVPFFYESIFFGFLIDVLYGSQTHQGFTFMFPFAILLSILVVALLPIRQYLRIDHV